MSELFLAFLSIQVLRPCDQETQLPYMFVGNMGDFRNVGTHKNEGIGTNSGPDYPGNTSASGVTDKTGQPLQGETLTDVACQIVCNTPFRRLDSLCIGFVTQTLESPAACLG